MLDAKFIRENLQGFRQSLKKRFIDVDLDEILSLDEKRAELQKEVDQRKAERNRITGQIARNPAKKSQLQNQGKKLKEEIAKLEKELEKISRDLEQLLLRAPNLLAPDVPQGRTEEESVEIKKWGKLPKFDFKPKDHVELGGSLDIINFEVAAKVAGSRFYYLKNEAAFIEFALVNFVFETLTEKGFIPIIPPELGELRRSFGECKSRNSLVLTG